jgi:uncharacterized protein (DUF2237 family)
MGQALTCCGKLNCKKKWDRLLTVNMSGNETEQVTKPARGSWHGLAAEMRAEGLAYHDIGRRLGVSGPAVYFALNPGKRWRKKKGATAPSVSSPVA